MDPETTDKPKPFPIVPRKQWLEARFKELAVAIIQNLEIDLEVPVVAYKEIEKVASELRTKRHLLLSDAEETETPT